MESDSQTRLRMLVSYDGTTFSGWAAQPERRTVEGQLRGALATLLRCPVAQVPPLVVAGRTDAGVHAWAQVVHLDVSAHWLAGQASDSRTGEQALLRRLNGVLSAQRDVDLVVRRVERAPAGFDARFSAISRRYRYRILDQPALYDPLRRHDTVLIAERLDVRAMNAAGSTLLGLHDFAAFCRKREGASTIRTLLECSWATVDGIIEGRVVADAFCHSMVRALVGSLIPVGLGRVDPAWPAQVLSDQVRDPRVKVMPAHGLSLMEVSYPPDAELAQRALSARRRREPGELVGEPPDAGASGILSKSSG